MAEIALIATEIARKLVFIFVNFSNCCEFISATMHGQNVKLASLDRAEDGAVRPEF